MILSWTVGKSQGITHELTGMPGIFFLTDCGSTNGIWQREKTITHTRLSNGFTFKIFAYFSTGPPDRY